MIKNTYSTNVNETITSLLENLKYRTTGMGTGHEFEENLFSYFADGLHKFGFLKIESGEWKKETDRVKKKGKNEFIENNVAVVVNQPNGSQRPPDLLICKGSTELYVEAKSSQEGKIMWNGGLPNKDFIYVITKTLKPAFTYSTGFDIENPAQVVNLKKIHRELNEYLETIVDPENDAHITYYIRAMHTDNHNYFSDKDDMTLKENNVIKVIYGLIWEN